MLSLVDCCLRGDNVVEFFMGSPPAPWVLYPGIRSRFLPPLFWVARRARLLASLAAAFLALSHNPYCNGGLKLIRSMTYS